METKQRRLVWGGIATGLLHGLLTRWVFGLHHPDAATQGSAYSVMTSAFVFGAPLTMGFLAVWIAERAGPVGWKTRVMLPWVSSLAGLGATLLLEWEGLICVVMLAPVMLLLSTIGGLLAIGVRRAMGRDGQVRCAALVALLPFLAAPVERLRSQADEILEVRNVIDIAAPPERVWQEIRSVPRIAEEEHSDSWLHRMGFPRPVEAVLQGEGVGSVRIAQFERGLVFVERVTEWKPSERLAFTIRADTANIPAKTLDEHVKVGGPYFDVLDGVYEIEAGMVGTVRLHLASRQRLGTRFNWYASLWSGRVMSELQTYILRIVKRRAESSPQRLSNTGEEAATKVIRQC
jgi:uncharacterized protein YndB with AHSA1/START domain